MHFSDLTPASRALLLSQAGPFAARAFNVAPTRDDVTVYTQCLVSRPAAAPPTAPTAAVAPRRCSCRGQLDALGDHRTACATSGVLATGPAP